LVPGCGRGYDVVALAAAGAKEAVGLELAAAAVKVSTYGICFMPWECPILYRFLSLSL